MGIDWFTFCAQIVNFLILVALLRRFLYGPIVEAMQAREASIAERVAAADQRYEDAADKAETLRQQTDRLNQRGEEMLADIRKSVKRQQQQLMLEARESVDRRREAWYTGLQREQAELSQVIRRDTGVQALAVARRVLADIADRDLHEQVVRVFLKRITELPSDQRKLLSDAAAESHERIVVSSAFPLSPTDEATVRGALAKGLRTSNDIVFRDRSDLVCGLEVRVGGHQVAWSIEEFVDSVALEFQKEISVGQPVTAP